MVGKGRVLRSAGATAGTGAGMITPLSRPPRISLADLHWTAGFLESRGHFCTDDSGGNRPLLRLMCKNIEPLQKLKSLYGGCLTRDITTWRWRLVGKKAIGLAFTLWPIVSPHRRGEFEIMIRRWYDDGPVVKRDRRHRKQRKQRNYISGAVDFWRDRT